MPQTISTPALCLRCRPFKEQDLLIDAYTLEQGRLSLLVKGGRKLSSKLAGHVEPLMLLELMVINGRSLPTAAAASSRHCYPSLKSDFDKISAAGFAIFQFNRLVKEGVRDDYVFHLLSDFLALLNEAKAEAEWYHWLAKMFLILLLRHLGHGPNKNTPFVVGNSLYEITAQKITNAEFKKMNRWLDSFLPAAIENAV